MKLNVVLYDGNEYTFDMDDVKDLAFQDIGGHGEEIANVIPVDIKEEIPTEMNMDTAPGTEKIEVAEPIPTIAEGVIAEAVAEPVPEENIENENISVPNVDEAVPEIEKAEEIPIEEDVVSEVVNDILEGEVECTPTVSDIPEKTEKITEIPNTSMTEI